MEYILIIIAFLITSLAQVILMAKYKKYKKVDINSNLTGKEVAEKILKKYDLTDITINEISGNLTDHFNNSNRTVNLSSDIYNGTSIASTAVAAHECGHALQYKYGYGPIKLRNNLVPIVNFGNKIGYIALVIGFATSIADIVLIGTILVSFAVVFQLVTLPVEFDASRRANKVILEMGLVTKGEQKGTKKILRAAAFTYVAGLISSIMEVLRLVLIFSNRRRD